MTNDWDKISERLLSYEQTNEKELRPWGYANPINVYKNLIERNLVREKEKTAFVSFEGKNVLEYTYEEANTKAKSIAYLLEQHVSAQERILIIGPPCAGTTFTILASSYVGCEHTVLMPSISEEAVKKVISLFKPNIIIICNISERRSYANIPVIYIESNINGIEANGKEISITTNNTSYTYKPEDRLFSLFTSGTTGSPKKITHCAYGYLLFAAYTIEYYFNFKSNSSILCGSEAGWINGHTYSIYGPLLKGGSSILIQEPSRLCSMEYMVEIAEITKFEILYLPVTTIRLLRAVDLNARRNPVKKDLINIKAIGSMGEMLAPTIENWYGQKFTDVPIPVVNTYFQTETGGILCAKRWNNKPGIVEGEIGEVPWYLDIKTDAQGQLFMAKSIPGLMVSASSNDRSSKDINDYYYTEEMDFMLHDYGKVVENKLYVSGRNDDVLKIKGIRIASGQIESVAIESPEIIECAAVEAVGRLEIPEIALFATINGKIKDDIELRRLLECINKLIAKKIGKHISISTIHILDRMPKTKSGKIRRNQLRQELQSDQI